jgi:hypothetical protein
MYKLLSFLAILLIFSSCSQKVTKNEVDKATPFNLEASKKTFTEYKNLIDGANENSNSKDLFDSIIQFLDQYKVGQIKVVLSWRVNTKSELPQADEQFESIVYNDSNDSNREENLIARSCYWLKPLNKVEVEGAWNKYINDKQDKVRRKPNFSYEELTYHDRSLSDQLDNPLLLRLFLELNNGKGLPKSRGGFTSIWSLYHEKLISQ